MDATDYTSSVGWKNETLDTLHYHSTASSNWHTEIMYIGMCKSYCVVNCDI